MPSPSYEINKKHIYKWREANPEHYRAIGRKWKQKRDAWKKFINIFPFILELI